MNQLTKFQEFLDSLDNDFLLKRVDSWNNGSNIIYSFKDNYKKFNIAFYTANGKVAWIEIEGYDDY